MNELRGQICDSLKKSVTEIHIFVAKDISTLGPSINKLLFQNYEEISDIFENLKTIEILNMYSHISSGGINSILNLSTKRNCYVSYSNEIPTNMFQIRLHNANVCAVDDSRISMLNVSNIAFSTEYISDKYDKLAISKIKSEDFASPLFLIKPTLIEIKNPKSLNANNLLYEKYSSIIQGLNLESEEKDNTQKNIEIKPYILADLTCSEIRCNLSQLLFILEELDIKNTNVDLKIDGEEKDELILSAIQIFNKFKENIKSLKLNVLIGNCKESKRSTCSCDFTAFIKLILLLLSLNIIELNLTCKEEIIKRKFPKDSRNLLIKKILELK